MNSPFWITVKNLWKLIRPFRFHFLFSLVLVSLKESWSVASVWLSGFIITSAIAGDWGVVFTRMAMLIAGIAGAALCNYLYDRNFATNLGVFFEKHIEEYSLRKILRLTVAQHKDEHSAIKLDVVDKGEDATQHLAVDFIYNLLPSIVFLLVAIISLAIVHPIFGIAEIVVFVLLFTWSLLFQKNQYPYVIKNRDNWNLQRKERHEVFSHLELAKILHREDYLVEKYIAGKEKVLKYHVFTHIRNLRNFVLNTFSRESIAVCFLGYSIYLFSEGIIESGTIFVLYTLTSQIVSRVYTLERIVRDTPEKWAKIEKYFSIVQRDPSFDEIGDSPKSLSEDIIIRDLCFSYKEGLPVIESLSVVIPAGKTTAFVGSSGSGKTTVSRLLLRAYSYSKGSILMGDQELSTIDAGELRERIGVVEQHVDLFDDTVRENILIGVASDKRDEINAQMNEICKRARINEFKERLGIDGYDALVGERGLKLSGGERQRIGIARALAKNPDIFLFDEATASLDSINEKHVMDAVYDAAKGKTTIIIAHRLSTVRNADKIVVMDHGTVVAEGTHDELMKSSNHYLELVKHQTEVGLV